MDSEIGLPGKGRAEISGIALIRAPKKWRWVITDATEAFISNSGRMLGPHDGWD
jgi:hypothetical protein